MSAATSISLSSTYLTHNGFNGGLKSAGFTPWRYKDRQGRRAGQRCIVRMCKAPEDVMDVHEAGVVVATPQFELKPLPYAFDALEPHISKQTLEYHWGRHHKAYVDNLNKQIEEPEKTEDEEEEEEGQAESGEEGQKESGEEDQTAKEVQNPNGKIATVAEISNPKKETVGEVEKPTSKKETVEEVENQNQKTQNIEETEENVEKPNPQPQKEEETEESESGVEGLTEGSPKNKLAVLLDGLTLEEAVRVTYNKGNPLPAFDNAAQAWNHEFFWDSMKPGGGGKPTGEILAQIKKDFGSYKAFVNEFKTKAASQFGSGWTWLTYKIMKLDVENAKNPLPSEDDKKLVIVKSPNAVTPLVWDYYYPLLTIDVWEHAYFLDFQYRRPDYISIFMDKLVSWDAVNARFEAALAHVAQIELEEKIKEEEKDKELLRLRRRFGQPVKDIKAEAAKGSEAVDSEAEAVDSEAEAVQGSDAENSEAEGQAS